MRQLVRLCALFLLTTATLATAQPTFVGDTFPLTHTRYGTTTAQSGRLITDGIDFFLFWQSGPNIRMTKLLENERRVGKAVLGLSGDFDVIWTGQHFLVVGTNAPGLVGQLVNVHGDRVGGDFDILPDGTHPYLVSNGQSIVVLYRKAAKNANQLYAATLNLVGGLTRAERELLPATPSTIRWYTAGSHGDGFAVLAARSDSDRLIILDRNGEVRSTQVVGTEALSGAIVSNGEGYLMAMTSRRATTEVATFVSQVLPDGRILRTLPLNQTGTLTSLIRTAIGYTAAFRGATLAEVVHLDAKGESVSAVEPFGLETEGASLQLAAIGQKILTAWISSNGRGFTADLPLTSPRVREVLIGAGRQFVRAAVAGNDSTLFVWNENLDGRDSLRAGTRSRDGLWTEHLIAQSYETGALVATDGREFVVLYGPTADQLVLQRLSSSGERVGAAVPVDLPFSPTSMTWNGERYVIAGGYPPPVEAIDFGHPDIVAAFVSPSGAVSEPMFVARTSTSSQPAAYFTPEIAWNGNSYFVLWHSLAFRNGQEVVIVQGRRLDSDLNRIAGSDVEFTDDAQVLSDLDWDGSHFVVLRKDDKLYVTRLTAAGRVIGDTAIPHSERTEAASIAAVSGGFAVAWYDEATSTHYVTSFRSGSGTIAGTEAVLTTDFDQFGPKIVALPGGKAAFATSVPVEQAPHHGAIRAIAAVLDLAPLAAPKTAPKVTLRLERNRLFIEWTALAEPVTGYRVEYRVADGNWNEIERSSDPNIRTAQFTVSRPNTIYSFRVRAVNDGGLGPYSTPAKAYLGKRRSVR